MFDAAAFQERFGSALAGLQAVDDPALARAIRIHRNTAMSAAIDALAANYPVVAALLGDESFTALATNFVDRHPPSDPRLCVYGAAFPAFLAGEESLGELPYLPDVAMLEGLVVEALFASDAHALDARTIEAELDAERPLVLHPSVRWARLVSPAASIWLAHLDADPAERLETIEWNAETALVSRPSKAVEVMAVDPAVADFLDGCAESLPLGETVPLLGSKLADQFALLVNAGVFIPSFERSEP